jgi:voltage-dependent potassium channel beta subunit
MQYRRLGRSGLKLSALSFGSWVTFSTQVDERAASDLMKLAYDGGVNFFDNAEAYANGESETLMGRVLKKMNWPRDSYCVSSKVFWGGKLPTQRGLSKKHVRDACDAALARLKVDYLDLYFCHRPDPETPIEETVRAMHELVAQGKVLYWGTSEWSAAEIAEAFGVARAQNLTPPTMEQPQYNLLARGRVEFKYLRIYEDQGLGLTTYSPLASGVLTGKYLDGIPDDTRGALPGYEWLHHSMNNERTKEKVRRLQAIAAELGCTPAQLAIAWCAKNPRVTSVITGASRVAQVHENLRALDVMAQLDPSVMERIDQAVTGR